VSTWVGLVAVLLGVGLALLGISRALEDDEPVEEPVQTPIRTVADSVPINATETEQIGQRRVVSTSRGRLIVVYPGPDGMSIVADQANQGRSWRSPVTLPALVATSLSVVADDEGRLHVAFADGAGISYTVLTETDTGWNASNVVSIDESPSEIVDVAWDPLRELAHVVWASSDDGGEAPEWAAFDARDSLDMVATERLADSAPDVPVLVNLAASPGGEVIATYRRGDTRTGWFARALVADARPGELGWGPEERLRMDLRAAAASVAFDDQDTAHLVLVDEARASLSYFKRNPRTGWSSRQVALDPGVAGRIDNPSVSVDLASRLVYVFFDTDEGASPIRLVLRDPVSGWEGPYRVGTAAELPAGALFPTSMATTRGQPIVLWTTAANPSELQMARVTAP
jgi:hypothetical protein